MKEIDTICSFCGRPARELTDIISNPEGDCFICKDCLNICRDVLEFQQRTKNSEKNNFIHLLQYSVNSAIIYTVSESITEKQKRG
jgi:ATP-dependent protease Clp ATPase subunit